MRLKFGLEDKLTIELANDIDIIQYLQVYTNSVDDSKHILLVNCVYC